MGRLTGALKGRDIEAVAVFTRRVREALPGILREVRFTGHRTLDVSPEAAAPLLPDEAGKGRVRPIPKPPSELRLVCTLERRDVLIEEALDALAYEVSRANGTVVSVFACTAVDLAGVLQATRLAEESAAGEVLWPEPKEGGA